MIPELGESRNLGLWKNDPGSYFSTVMIFMVIGPILGAASIGSSRLDVALVVAGFLITFGVFLTAGTIRHERDVARNDTSDLAVQRIKDDTPLEGRGY